MDRSDYSLDESVTYLNHGSFGPSPIRVQEVRQEWASRLERQPMKFLTRDMEPALKEAMKPLADLLATDADNMTFVDNATFGMNIVANTISLTRGDEVLLSDHEYGAVMRVWMEKCRRSGANMIVRKIPEPLDNHQSIAEAILSGITERTKLIVISHVTSATAAIFPVKEICREARRLKIPVCIDGPHAVGMIPVNLTDIDCDFYCASCHKWLSAPFGTGFLYVAPRWQHRIVPAVTSWGGSVSGQPATWQDEFNWIGTRDPSGFLSIPQAIECLQNHGLEQFRQQTHEMVRLAAARIEEITGMMKIVPDSQDWYGSMITLPIPGPVPDGEQHGRRDPLQLAFRDRYQIEIPVFSWKRRRYLRISSYLYNDYQEIDKFVSAFVELKTEFCTE